MDRAPGAYSVAEAVLGLASYRLPYLASCGNRSGGLIVW